MKHKTIIFILLCMFELGPKLAAQITPDSPFKRWIEETKSIEWGKETNGLRAGVTVMVKTNGTGISIPDLWCRSWLMFRSNSTTVMFRSNSATIFYFDSGNNKSNSFVVSLQGTQVTRDATNIVWSPLMAFIGISSPLENNIRMELMNEKGVLIPRAKGGEASRLAFIENLNSMTNHYKHKFLTSDNPEILFGPFRLNDYFKITSSGKYRLQMEILVFPIYLSDAKNQRYGRLPLLPVDVEFEIPGAGDKKSK